jgi:hypothetical protein
MKPMYFSETSDYAKIDMPSSSTSLVTAPDSYPKISDNDHDFYIVVKCCVSSYDSYQ